jgi:Protein of unknown function (DUF4089)
MTKRAKSLSKGKAKAETKTSRARPAKTARAKVKRAKRKPAAGDALADFVDAAVRALDLPLELAWKGAVRANLEVTLALAASFADFPLPDDAEPAPVFTA